MPRIRMVTGDFVEDYEVVAPFPALRAEEAGDPGRMGRPGTRIGHRQAVTA